MARYKTGSNAKDRRNQPCNGYRNWDTSQTITVIRNDRKCYNFVKNNSDRLLGMKKNDKLSLIKWYSSNGLGGVNCRNVDYRELNAELNRIKDLK